MAKYCYVYKKKVLYLDCLECDYKNNCKAKHKELKEKKEIKEN